MSVTIYHNPRCSKSRQTLHLLTERGIEARVVEYLKTPPDSKELKQILIDSIRRSRRRSKAIVPQ